MPSAQIPCVEMVALRTLSDLEQLKGTCMERMHSKGPEPVALAFWLRLAHLVRSSKNVQMADVIQSVEKQGETAFKAVGQK